MRKIILAAALAISPVLAWAACTTHSYWVNGKYTTCTTCCFGSNCTTNCY